MKRTTGQWRTAIIECASNFADREWQARTWFGQDPHVISSPDEMICQLCDELELEEFLAEQESRLSEGQLTRAYDLLQEIEQFCDEEPSVSDPRTTLDNPRWERIRVAASKFLKAFSS
jgi:hypothetical protein